MPTSPDVRRLVTYVPDVTAEVALPTADAPRLIRRGLRVARGLLVDMPDAGQLDAEGSWGLSAMKHPVPLTLGYIHYGYSTLARPGRRQLLAPLEQVGDNRA